MDIRNEGSETITISHKLKGCDDVKEATTRLLVVFQRPHLFCL